MVIEFPHKNFDQIQLTMKNMFERPLQRTLFDFAFGVYTAILALIVIALLVSTHYLSYLTRHSLPQFLAWRCTCNSSR
jgi:hypothetical protein